VDAMVAAGDETGGGLKGYLDNLEQNLAEEREINKALWERFGMAPGDATAAQWRALADALEQEGYELYKKYTKTGIQQYVAEKRGAKLSGWMTVGKEQVRVRQGAFSAAAAKRMEGELWKEGKGELSKAMGELLQRAGYSADDIAQASYEQRTRLLEELGNKDLQRISRGRVAKIDKVPMGSREQVVGGVDFDLAAICGNSAVDPLAMPTLDAYGKMELADKIRAVKVGDEGQGGGGGELNFAEVAGG